MNMQQATQPQPSANGFRHHVVDKNTGTQPESKSLPGKPCSNNFSNSKPVIGTKTGVLESSSLDRIIYVSACLIGHPVEVHVKNGSILSGIFHAMNAERDFGVVLKMARVIKDTSIKGPKNVLDTAKSPQTVIVSARDLVQVIAKEISLSGKSFSSENARGKCQDFMIDSAISQSYHTEERELEHWTPDVDDLHCPELENIFDGSWDRNWDQFETNKALFGVKSTFNEELYTTKLERGPQTRELEIEASRIAREIKGEETEDLHLAEERGIYLHGNFDLDEESRFSAVHRVVDDGTYVEQENVFLDAVNAETFGDSMASAITSSSFAFSEREVNDATEVSASCLQMEEVASSQISALRPTHDHSDCESKNFPPFNDKSSVERKQSLSYNGVGKCALEHTEMTIFGETQASKHKRGESHTDAQNSSFDKETSSSSVTPSPPCLQENRDFVVGSSGPATSKTVSVASEHVNNNPRPSSSTSSTSNRVGGSSVTSSPGLSPSSSMGSLTSEKSKLNPYAKEFKFNPNAKLFNPSSSLRPHSPVADIPPYHTANIYAFPHMQGLPVPGMAPPFGGHQPVMYNTQALHMQSPQAYIHPGGPVYGQQQMIFNSSRPVMYMPNYPPDMPHRERGF